jgi:hypothetical protein
MSLGLGAYAGNNQQGSYSVAVGGYCALDSQGFGTVAVGWSAGFSIQQSGAVAIGYSAGLTSQGTSAIAIGYGAGQTQQHANSIILNASGTIQNSAQASSFFVNPIRRVAPSTTTMYGLMYNATTKEVTASATLLTAAKAFIIDHPDDPERYLVHTCLEGPEVGVYYRGKGEITNAESTVITLPPYVANLAYDFTIQITQIYDDRVKTYGASEVENNQFTVYGPNGRFFWMANGTRGETVIEPLKSQTNVQGNGPYRWLG